MISPDDLKNSEENVKRLRSELVVKKHRKEPIADAEKALRDAEDSHRQMSRAYTEQMQQAYIQNHMKQLLR